MPRYQIHIDPTPPDSEEIRNRQNFDELYAQFQAAKQIDDLPKSHSHTGAIIGWAMAAVGVLLLVYFAISSDPASKALAPTDSDPAANTTIFDSPLIPEHTWEVTTAKDTLFNLSQNVNLYLPASTLRDSLREGQTLRISYRLLDQAAEQFVSGVFGAEQPLGIFASIDGQPVSQLPGATLQIFQGGDNLYAWQRTEQIWTPIKGNSLSYLSTNPATPIPRPAAPTILSQQASDQGIPELVPAPVPPRKPFGVKVRNRDDLPQFRERPIVFWEYLPEPGSTDPWEAGLIDDTWGQVHVKPIRKGTFELNFSRSNSAGGLDIRRVIARPYPANTEEQAMALFETRLSEYHEQMAQRKAILLQIQAFEKAKARALLDHEAAIRAWEAKKDGEMEAASKIIEYPLAQFGYYADSPIETPSHPFNLSLFLASKGHPGGQQTAFSRVAIASSKGKSLRMASLSDHKWQVTHSPEYDSVWAVADGKIWTGKIAKIANNEALVEMTSLPEHIQQGEDMIRFLQSPN